MSSQIKTYVHKSGFSFFCRPQFWQFLRAVKVQAAPLTKGWVLGPKKIPVIPVPDRPYFFLPTLLFLQCDWRCDPIFSGWLRAAHTVCQNGVCCHTNYWTKLPKFVHMKYVSLVNIDVGTLLKIPQQKNTKTMKKYSKKNLFPTYRP
jgi:hypothetical protein